MRILSCSRAACVVFTVLCVSPSSSFSETPEPRPPSVRAVTPYLRGAIADGVTGSAAFRSLIDRINQSDLIVYVRCRVFNELELRGRLTFLSATPERRYAVIELACVLQTRVAQMGILAHELQHAVEIASAPWVVDTKTLDRFYAARGRLVSSDAWTRTYETQAAVERARRVQRELWEADKTRGVHATDY